jgi:predicted DNA-binding protein (MmcQ/YjbR family)
MRSKRKRLPTQAKVLKKLRALCLSLPEATETDSFGHPNFRAGKGIYVAFEAMKGRPSIAFRLDPDEVDLLLLDTARFFPTPYGKGRWASIWADIPLDWKEITGLVTRSYRGVALKRMLAALERQAR